MVHFCCLVNIVAMVIRCMPVDAKHFPIVRSGSTCGGTLSEKRKDRKILFFYGNHFEEIQIWIRFSANPDSEQSLTKSKKNYDSHPLSDSLLFTALVAQPLSACLPGGIVGYPAQPGLTWRNRRLPSPTRICLFLCNSDRL